MFGVGVDGVVSTHPMGRWAVPTHLDEVESTAGPASADRETCTRRRIQDSGVEIRSEEGVRGAAGEGISRRTGIAKTTIYQ